MNTTCASLLQTLEAGERVQDREMGFCTLRRKEKGNKRKQKLMD